MDPKGCCQWTELAAILKMDGTIQIYRQNLAMVVATENAAVARKVVILIKKLLRLQTEVVVQRKVRLKKNNIYIVRISPHPRVEKNLVKLGLWDADNKMPQNIIKLAKLANNCCRRAYLRGSFLGGGSISNPEGDYHFEIITDDEEHASQICHIMVQLGLGAKISFRKNRYVTYLKESDQIVECLNLMGAHQALLELENIRIYKGLRNQVNRLVNCETANLNKTVNAAVRQLENIKLIDSTMGLSKLPSSLWEVAELRLKNPNISLKELGELMNPPVGKSGVNHRMRKLEQVAKKIRRAGAGRVK